MGTMKQRLFVLELHPKLAAGVTYIDAGNVSQRQRVNTEGCLVPAVEQVHGRDQLVRLTQELLKVCSTE